MYTCATVQIELFMYTIYMAVHVYSLIGAEYVVTTTISKSLHLQEAFILLDLIGAANPTFHDMFTETTNLYQRLSRIGM